MIAKERGWVLSIDQAANAAGASLWYNGALVGTATLRSRRATDSISVRLRTIVDQLTEFLREKLPEGDRIVTVIFEGVQSRMVMITVGAFLVCPYLDARISPTLSFVQSSSWKSWAAKRGASGPKKDIKGVKALREVGFPVENIASDDEGDSCLIFMTWREKP